MSFWRLICGAGFLSWRNLRLRHEKIHSAECGAFALCCSISVTARRPQNFPSSSRGVVALTSSCWAEITLYVLFACSSVDWISPARHKYAPSWPPKNPILIAHLEKYFSSQTVFFICQRCSFQWEATGNIKSRKSNPQRTLGELF